MVSGNLRNPRSTIRLTFDFGSNFCVRIASEFGILGNPGAKLRSVLSPLCPDFPWGCLKSGSNFAPGFHSQFFIYSVMFFLCRHLCDLENDLYSVFNDLYSCCNDLYSDFNDSQNVFNNS